MHHNYDSSISASVTAAEANQSSYVPTAAMQVSFYEAAKAKCLRCKVNSSKAGRHTCALRRNSPPAATGEKRSRPTRGSAVPPTAPETRLPDPVSTNLDDSQQHSVALEHMTPHSPETFETTNGDEMLNLTGSGAMLMQALPEQVQEAPPPMAKLLPDVKAKGLIEPSKPPPCISCALTLNASPVASPKVALPLRFS